MKGKGRRKIEMKKIENKNNLQVTFSKRRSGVFKKASELCTLCGAEVCVIMISPSDKVFSFGHPNVNTMLHCYLTMAPPHATQFMGAKMHELNAQLTKFNDQIEIQTSRANELKRLRKVVQTQWWWATPINEMNIMQLKKFNEALQKVKMDIARKFEEIPIQYAIL